MPDIDRDRVVATLNQNPGSGACWRCPLHPLFLPGVRIRADPDRFVAPRPEPANRWCTPRTSANGSRRSGPILSLAIGALLDSHKHDIAAMLKESLEEEGRALTLYRELLAEVEGRSVALEEFARQMILAEELHAAEVDKMVAQARRPRRILETASSHRPLSSRSPVPKARRTPCAETSRMLFNFAPPVTDARRFARHRCSTCARSAASTRPRRLTKPRFSLPSRWLAAVSTTLLHSLETSAPPEDRARGGRQGASARCRSLRPRAERLMTPR